MDTAERIAEESCGDYRKQAYQSKPGRSWHAVGKSVFACMKSKIGGADHGNSRDLIAIRKTRRGLDRLSEKRQIQKQ